VGTDEITGAVIGTAIAVHRTLGPGLLESTYEMCLAAELAARGINYQRQQVLPVSYRNLNIENGYRVDFLVENSVVVELKSVSTIDQVHIAQLLTYLKLSGCHAGLLINFNTTMLRDGIKRLVL